MAEKPIKITLTKVDPHLSVSVPPGAHGSIEGITAPGGGTHDVMLGTHGAAMISLPSARTVQKIKIELDEAGNIGLSFE